ncbi:MAG TPA: hypothetical protein VMU57_00645 [Edaphobacter sp.]|uniref:hypothetical protein n=1 Tax=Edaphobacter sp. TaxID=1934404 RepID=UPI002CBE2030|nr:hypothetical protein [Edaphobacter sp.]HUZ93399.1 hypothetical protein [Edaphobacter sp.]
MSLAPISSIPPAPAPVEPKSAPAAPTASPVVKTPAQDTVSISSAAHQAAASSDPDHDGH